MGRSTFRDEVLRAETPNERDRQLLEELCELARPRTLRVVKKALDDEVGGAVQAINDQGIMALSLVLADEGDHEAAQQMADEVKRHLESGGVRADNEEQDAVAREVSHILVRAWLQHMLDVDAARAIGPEDVLPRTHASLEWNPVWRSVSTYNVSPQGAHKIVMSLCEQLFSRGSGSIELPLQLSIKKEILEKALESAGSQLFVAA